MENPSPLFLFFDRDRCKVLQMKSHWRWRNCLAMAKMKTITTISSEQSKHVEVSSGAVAASLKQVTIDIKSNLNNITTIFQASNKTLKNESFLISQVLKVRRKGRQLTDFSWHWHISGSHNKYTESTKLFPGFLYTSNSKPYLFSYLYLGTWEDEVWSHVA